MENHEDFVAWLRSVAPYIHAFRGKTFVIAFPGELVKADYLTVLAHDISLLQALGIKVVLVHGSRPQVAEQLLLRNVKEQFFNVASFNEHSPNVILSRLESFIL